MEIIISNREWSYIHVCMYAVVQRVVLLISRSYQIHKYCDIIQFVQRFVMRKDRYQHLKTYSYSDNIYYNTIKVWDKLKRYVGYQYIDKSPQRTICMRNMIEMIISRVIPYWIQWKLSLSHVRIIKHTKLTGIKIWSQPYHWACRRVLILCLSLESALSLGHDLLSHTLCINFTHNLY